MTQHPLFTTNTTHADSTSGRRHTPAHEPSALSPRRHLVRPLSVGLLIAASFSVVACGKDEPKAATILNTEKVERAIEHSVTAQRGKTARVSCPSGVHQKKGLTFSCTATVKRVNTQFTVTQQDGAGRVRYAAR